MREVAPAAYLGSWALVLPTVQNLVGGAPLLERIRATHAAALADLAAMATAWDDLEPHLGADARWAGVRARFLQQRNDAAVFSDTILSYYASLSGL